MIDYSFVLLAMLASVWTAIQLIKESWFGDRARAFFCIGFLLFVIIWVTWLVAVFLGKV